MNSSTNIFDFQQYPGIYIPMLFKNINEKQLWKIIEDLDIFRPKTMTISPKILDNGTHCNYVFIDVDEWYNTPNARLMRNKLLSDEEVKIVFNDPWFFICKRKHVVQESSSSTTSTQSMTDTYIDFKPVKDSMHVSDDISYCPECEDGTDGNQLRHTCIQRMMEEGNQ